MGPTAFLIGTAPGKKSMTGCLWPTGIRWDDIQQHPLFGASNEAKIIAAISFGLPTLRSPAHICGSKGLLQVDVFRQGAAFNHIAEAVCDDEPV
jgi:hypothetical protein